MQFIQILHTHIKYFLFNNIEKKSQHISSQILFAYIKNDNIDIKKQINKILKIE